MNTNYTNQRDSSTPMNRIAYASDLIEDATGLLLVTLSDLEPQHYAIVRRVIAQLSLYREAVMLCEGPEAWGAYVSEHLYCDVEAMLGHDVSMMRSTDLMDEYVSCRLDSSISVLQRVAGHYLEGEYPGMVNTGCAVFEACHWVIAALNAVRIETESRLKPSLSIAA